MRQVSMFRLYVLRAMYVFMFFGGVADLQDSVIRNHE